MNYSIFVYPIVPIQLSATKNPYISDLIGAYEKTGNVVINKNDETHTGVLSIIRYFFKADIFHFNWIEYLTNKKFGGFQLLVFLFQILFFKIFRKRIVWTVHNLSSHYSDNLMYKFIQKIMIVTSDLIIIHTKESYDFLEKKGVDKSKTFYFFHPFKQLPISNNENHEKKYDILIWGLMSPYKGVYEFLEYLKKNKLHYKVLLAGKFSDSDYFDKVNSVATSNTIINNCFTDDQKLLDLHLQSRFILFPYNSLSVLNSGSLTLSLSYNSKIIGPRRGAFKELGDLDIIYNFDTYADIVKLLNNDSWILDNNQTKDFILNNTWDNFGIAIDNKFNKF